VVVCRVDFVESKNNMSYSWYVCASQRVNDHSPSFRGTIKN
jgi:hypothetical protein